MIRIENKADAVLDLGEVVPVNERELGLRYRDLFENATDLIQSLNPDGTIALVNRAWLKALQYEPEEVVGLSFHAIVHPDHADFARAMRLRLLAGEHLEPIKAVFVSKSGRNIVVEGNCMCRFEGGVPISICGIFRDVTERKHREEELRRTQALKLPTSERCGRDHSDAAPGQAGFADEKGAHS